MTATASRPTSATTGTSAAPADERTAAVRRFLEGDLAWVWDGVREVLEAPELAVVGHLPHEEHRARVTEQTRFLAQRPEAAAGFPEEFGGSDDVAAYVTAFQALAYGDLSLLVKLGVQFGLFGGAILHLGSRSHHERYLPGAVSFDTPGCFGMTETGHGSNVQSVRTTATYDPETQEFVLRTPDDEARKDYIGNAARDGVLAVVFAQLVTQGEGRGVHAFVVPIRGEDGEALPGVTIEDDGAKAGLHGVDNGRLAFADVRVPRDALLDRFASVDADGTYASPIESETKRFFTTLGTLIQGRVSVAGGANSAAKVALVVAVRYAQRRRQFGPPDGDEEVRLLDYRVHQRRLLPLLATTYAFSAAQRVLVQRLHETMTRDDVDDGDRRRFEALVAGVKALGTWHTTRTVQTCREACGGAGYLAENRLPQLKADTDVFTTFEGDNTVLLQLVAKELLTGFRDDVSDKSPVEMARFVTEQAFEQVLERTGTRRLLQRARDVVPGRDDEPDLADRESQLELLRWREEHVLSGCARRLRAGIGDGAEPFDVFNACQDHVLLTARAHVERVVAEFFADAVEECEDPEARALLERLCDLHCLSLLEAERGWFLEHGRLTPARSKSLQGLVNDRCAALRDDASTLVEAFGVPEPAVAAVIARKADG